MSEIKITASDGDAGGFLTALDGDARMDPDARQLLQMAALLGPRAFLQQHGKSDEALAVLDQIEAILQGRKADA